MIPIIHEINMVRHKGTSKNWHMARDRRLWRDGKEQTPGAALKRAVTGFATMPESIRICRPAGCGSFWLKEECSPCSYGLGIFDFCRRIAWIRLLSEILFELSKIFRNAPNANF